MELICWIVVCPGLGMTLSGPFELIQTLTCECRYSFMFPMFLQLLHFHQEIMKSFLHVSLGYPVHLFHFHQELVKSFLHVSFRYLVHIFHFHQEIYEVIPSCFFQISCSPFSHFHQELMKSFHVSFRYLVHIFHFHQELVKSFFHVSFRYHQELVKSFFHVSFRYSVHIFHFHQELVKSFMFLSDVFCSFFIFTGRLWTASRRS